MNGAGRRNKGIRGELEVCKLLADELGESFHRNLTQTRAGGGDLLEVRGWCIEIKRQERLSRPSWWAQCCAQASGIGEPMLFYRRSREPWTCFIHTRDGKYQWALSKMRPMRYGLSGCNGPSRLYRNRPDRGYPGLLPGKAMNRDQIDLHSVHPEHVAIHKRLLNWSRCQKSGGWQTNVLPMFDGYRDGYHELPVPRDPPDMNDSTKIQTAFKEIPEIHRHVIGWAYVRYGYPVHLICRDLQVRRYELAELIHAGRERILGQL